MIKIIESAVFTMGIKKIFSCDITSIWRVQDALWMMKRGKMEVALGLDEEILFVIVFVKDNVISYFSQNFYR